MALSDISFGYPFCPQTLESHRRRDSWKRSPQAVLSNPPILQDKPMHRLSQTGIRADTYLQQSRARDAAVTPAFQTVLQLDSLTVVERK